MANGFQPETERESKIIFLNYFLSCANPSQSKATRFLDRRSKKYADYCDPFPKFDHTPHKTKDGVIERKAVTLHLFRFRLSLFFFFIPASKRHPSFYSRELTDQIDFLRSKLHDIGKDVS